MTPIRREAPPKHTIAVDTNVLWHEDRDAPVNRTVDDFFSEHFDEFDLTLLVPEVVRGELLYQQISAALITLERLNEQFKTLRGVSAKDYKHRLTEARLRSDIETRFDGWLTKMGGELAPTPVGSIDWGEIVDAAVWRKSPFVGGKQNLDGEKGFRGAMILEAVSASFLSRGNDEMFVFVTNDGTLRACADARHNDHDDWIAHDSLEAVAAYLQLTKENLTSEFVKAIQSRASKKFFSQSSDNLYVTSGVPSLVRERFSDRFATIDPNPTAMPSLQGLLAPPGPTWESVNDEARWISGARFEQLVGEREFHWKSVVSFVQLFQATGSDYETLFLGPERLRVLSFGVYWTANVRSDGRFFDLSVDRIEEEPHEFRPPTVDDRTHYNLPGGEPVPWL